jgi:hypothetical protein
MLFRVGIHLGDVFVQADGRVYGEDVTEFHYASPKDRRVGTSMVTVYADGDSVDSKAFAVKK